MADLFSSLRSLLPQEYASRGQSSTNDDLEEATKYIKNLENSIKELGDKRDLLKKLSPPPPPPPSSSPGHDQLQHADNASPSSSTNNRDAEKDNYVTIHTFPGRLEIEISVKVGGEDAFPLSKVLKQVSLVHGLDVVNCVSSKVDEICKCLIHCDLANDQPITDFSELQRRLASEISSYVA